MQRWFSIFSFDAFQILSILFSRLKRCYIFLLAAAEQKQKRRSKNESKKILLAKADLNFHLTEANNAANDDGDDDVDVNVVNACRWFPDPIVETVGIVFAGIFVVATGRVGSCVPVCVCGHHRATTKAYPVQFSTVQLGWCWWQRRRRRRRHCCCPSTSCNEACCIILLTHRLCIHVAYFSAHRQHSRSRSPAAFTRRRTGLALSPYKTDV